MAENKDQFIDPLKIMNEFVMRPASEDPYPYSVYWQKRLAALCETQARLIQLLLTYTDPFELPPEDREFYHDLHRQWRAGNYSEQEESEEVPNGDEQAEE